MTPAVLKNARPHPARDATIHSIKCVENNDREGWLSIWHPDGVIEDPVGKSPMDPDGKGHRGIEAISAFYDTFIALGEVRFTIRQTFAAGNECANVGTITVKQADNSITRTELVMVYRVDEDGKVLSLKAYWEYEDTFSGMF